MVQEGRRPLLAPGSWLSIGLIYLYGVMTSASLSKVIPLLGDIGLHLGATPAQFAWLIGLMTALPALLASVAGSIIDRIGARTALVLAALVGVVVNLAYLLTNSLQAFMAIRVMEGLIAVGAYSAAPALIMATAAPERRGRAMAVWSTYTPVGFSLGMVMAGSFSGSENWRGGYLIHLVLFVGLVIAATLLPRSPAAPATAARPAGLFASWRQSGPLRLSSAFAALVLMGFGLSNVYPEWFSEVHATPMAQTSRILALVNLVMIPAGFITGVLIARGWRDSRLLAGLMVAAVALSLPLFQPGVAEPARIAAMVGWMVVQGSAIAVVSSALPRVVASPSQGAAAAGLLSQFAALISFATPLIWQPILHSGHWPGFIAVVAVASLAAWVLFPRRAAGAS
jgi:MFS family permease